MNNCLTYALRKFISEKGYLLVRKSHLAEFHGVGKFHPFHLVPHFLHMTDEGKITQLVRTSEEEALAKRLGSFFDWLWLWHFDGYIKEGDD